MSDPFLALRKCVNSLIKNTLNRVRRELCTIVDCFCVKSARKNENWVHMWRKNSSRINQNLYHSQNCTTRENSRQNVEQHTHTHFVRMSTFFNSIFRQICGFDVSLNHCYFCKLQSHIFGFDVYYGEDEFYKNMNRMYAKMSKILFGVWKYIECLRSHTIGLQTTE